MPCKCGNPAIFDKKNELCQSCYHRKWNQENRDKVNAAARLWRKNHPGKYEEVWKRYLANHPEKNLKHNPKLREKCKRARIESIYRKHDDDLKDDPERLNIKELVEGTEDDFQFRYT